MAHSPPNSIPQHIFLTGAKGRLASCVRPHLQKAGRTITGFSREETNEHRQLERLFQPGVLEGAQTLLHLAWSTLPATSERDIGSEWECDLPFLIKLLRHIVETPGLAQLHFIFFSSGGAVYGSDPGRPSLETDSCRPVGWYAQAKVAAEGIIRIFGERHGLVYTILRVSNPYGFPIPLERAQGIIPHAFHCARTGEALSLWGDGTARKDFLHYSDFNHGLQSVIDRRLTGTYNLASGSSASVVEVIQQIEAITQRTIRVEQGPARPWDVHSSSLDNRKLRDATGWAPKLSLAEGLKLTAHELPR